MKSLRSSSVFTRSANVFAFAALALTAACSPDAATAPEVKSSNGLLSGIVGGVTNLLTPAVALSRNEAVAAPITRSVTFTKNGGSISIEELGLRVEVPSGAIPRDTMTITVTALPGKSVAYDFQPHGTRFLKPLTFRQDMKQTNWNKVGFKGTLNGGYFANSSQLDLTRGLALLNELLPLTVRGTEATFNIFHFSGYMVSSGRQSQSSEAEF